MNDMTEYNAIMKKTDDIYRNVAKAMGLSDCVFWILYTLRESSSELTQSDICGIMFLSKQTINSALKGLDNKGFVELVDGKDKRSKNIRLTHSGALLCESTVDKVINAENSAFESLDAGERKIFLRLFRKSSDKLEEEIKKLKQEKI